MDLLSTLRMHMPVAACGDPLRRGPRRRDRHDRGGWRGRPRRPRPPIRSLRACMPRVPSRTRMFEHTLKKRASRNRKRGVSRMGMCTSEVRTRTDCETRPGRSPVCVSCVASVLYEKAPLVVFRTASRGRSVGPSGQICRRQLCICSTKKVRTFMKRL